MNAGGTVTSGVRSFSTVSVTTSNPLPEQVGVTEAIFRATINTFGQTAAVKFKYWADAAPTVIFEKAAQSVPALNGPQEVSARVTDLLENVAYSYRVSVELAGTETDGGAVAFTTETNVAPVAVNDLVFYAGQVVVDPLANDTDANGDVLTLDAITAPPDASLGVAMIEGQRSISYNPQFSVLDDDALTYRVIDPFRASAQAQLRLIAFRKRAGRYGGKITIGSGASARELTVALYLGAGGGITTSFMDWDDQGFQLKGVFDQRGRLSRTLAFDPVNDPDRSIAITLALDPDAAEIDGTFEETNAGGSTTGVIAFAMPKNGGTGGLAESGLRTGFLSPLAEVATLQGERVMTDGYVRMTVGKDAGRGTRGALRGAATGRGALPGERRGGGPRLCPRAQARERGRLHRNSADGR